VKKTGDVVAAAGVTADALNYSDAKLGSNGKLYFSKYAGGNESYSTVADLGKVGEKLGPPGVILGTGIDIIQGAQGTKSPTEVGINVYVGGVTLFGGPPGETAGAVFFAGEFVRDSIPKAPPHVTPNPHLASPEGLSSDF
jgi:hypothetical protein